MGLGDELADLPHDIEDVRVKPELADERSEVSIGIEHLDAEEVP